MEAQRKMRVARFRYLLAHTFALSAASGAAIAMAIFLHAAHDEGMLVADFWVCFWLFLSAIPVAWLGVIFGVVILWQILGRVAARIQGWPLGLGEEVVILTGEHRNTVAKVHEVWHERGQVRVDLGQELRVAVRDVFGAVEVCRCREDKPTEECGGDRA